MKHYLILAACLMTSANAMDFVDYSTASDKAVVKYCNETGGTMYRDYGCVVNYAHPNAPFNTPRFCQIVINNTKYNPQGQKQILAILKKKCNG